jgi:hypothetical protein
MLVPATGDHRTMAGDGTLPQARSGHQCHHPLDRAQNTGNVRVVDLVENRDAGNRFEDKEINLNH